MQVLSKVQQNLQPGLGRCTVYVACLELAEEQHGGNGAFRSNIR